jgi:hypothetical protein
MVPGEAPATDEGQLALFGERPSRLGTPPGQPSARQPQPPDQVRLELAALDPERLTPLEALNRLAELKRRAEQSP